MKGGEVVEGIFCLDLEEVVDIVASGVADAFEEFSWVDLVDGDVVLQSSQDAVPRGERPLVRVTRLVGFEEGVEDDGVGFARDFGDERYLF